jgi:hypothetical protein
MLVWCTNRSAPPSAGVMKPKPFSTLNHFTLPLVTASAMDAAMPRTPVRASALAPDVDASDARKAVIEERAKAESMLCRDSSVRSACIVRVKRGRPPPVNHIVSHDLFNHPRGAPHPPPGAAPQPVADHCNPAVSRAARGRVDPR